MELVPREIRLQLTPGEKVERLLQRSLDDINDLLDLPLRECDAGLLSARMQAVRVIVLVSAKLGIEARRQEDCQAYLREAENGVPAGSQGAGSGGRAQEGEIGEEGFFAGPVVIIGSVGEGGTRSRAYVCRHLAPCAQGFAARQS